MTKERLSVAAVALAAVLILSVSGSSPAKSRNDLAVVHLSGYALADSKGPFLGLGATYMSALWHCKSDYALLQRNLRLLSQSGFNYIRVLSMVGWEGREIAPVAFTNREGKIVPAWEDYEEQLGKLLDTAYDKYAMRVEITVFADAQFMPDRAQRQAHLDRILRVIKGREREVILVEVANEAWQNGFPGDEGMAEMREWCSYLKSRTSVLTALSSPWNTTVSGIRALYDGSKADIATVHFTRDMRSEEGGWLPVRACWDVARSVGMPVSSNEPVGPGSSVATEDNPLRLISAAAFAWTAGLPMYVLHSSSGVLGVKPFEEVPGIGSFAHLRKLLPPDLPNWKRSDGSEATNPLITGCERASDGRVIRTEASEVGCIYSPGASKANEFVSIPMGVREGGIDIALRRNCELRVYDPITGKRVMYKHARAGQRFHLPQGSGIYVIRGKLR